MADGTEHQHCLALVDLLNSDYGWNLSAEARLRYTQEITACWKHGSLPTDNQLTIAIRYYHEDHHLVEALREGQTGPWAVWVERTLRILLKRSGGHLSDSGATTFEDLTQEALLDLWRGLETFRYQSRFHTWAITVITNCLTRHYRTVNASKRATHYQIISIERGTLEEPLQTPHYLTLEPEIMSNEFAALIAQVLAHHPDQRVKRVFDLWVNQDQTIREIGDQLHLSPSRVHALITLALNTLRAEPTVQQWREADAQ